MSTQSIGTLWTYLGEPVDGSGSGKLSEEEGKWLIGE